MKMSKLAVSAIAATLVATTLTACGPGSSSSSKTASSEKVSTDVSSGKYQLELWDGAGLKSYDDALIAAFEKKHSNITIKAVYDPDSTSQQNGPRIISASDTPDIARITDINSAVRGKHVVNLDAYAKAYGWSLPESQTQVYQVDSSGKIGSGSLYAVPDGVSMTGVFWNKSIASKLGIKEAPKTVSKLESDMKKAKDAGILPMMMPAKDGGTSYIYQAILVGLEGRDKVQNWIIQKDGATFDTAEAQEAAKTIKSWKDKGYFSTDALALDSSTAVNRFGKGESLFYPAGSWYTATLSKALGSKVGWFAAPPTQANGDSTANANAVTAFGIPANAKNKNAAAAFLDFLQSDEARQISVEYGYPPIGDGDMPKSDDALLNEVLTSYSDLVKSGNTTDYINNATAGMQASAIIPQFQKLLDGSATPAEFTKAIQTQYESEIK